jgi:DNA-binding Lrp family transcriptional regulator
MARPIKTHDGDLSALLDDAQGNVPDVAQALGLSVKTIYRRIAAEGIDLPRGKGGNFRDVTDSEIRAALLEDDATVYIRDRDMLMVRRSQLKQAKRQLEEQTGLSERGSRNRLKKLERDMCVFVQVDSEPPAYLAWLAFKEDPERFLTMVRENIEHRMGLLDVEAGEFLSLLNANMPDLNRNQGQFLGHIVLLLSNRKLFARLEAERVLEKYASDLETWEIGDTQKVADFYALVMSKVQDATDEYMTQLPPWVSILFSETHRKQAERPPRRKKATNNEAHERQAKRFLEFAPLEEYRDYFNGIDLAGEMERLIAAEKKRFSNPRQ